MNIDSQYNFIFDMDGLLIDSEPYWQAVEKQVFQQVGIDLTDEMCLETVGLRLNDIVSHWYAKQPWENISPEEVGKRIIDGMKAKYEDKVPLKAGVSALIDRLSGLSHVKIAICSSSPLEVIKSVVTVSGFSHCIQYLHSAENDELGKPHSLPYIACAKKMQVPVDRCIAFEDSLNGAISAKAAGMLVVAVPEDQNKASHFLFCDKICDSLAAFDFDLFIEDMKGKEENRKDNAG